MTPHPSPFIALAEALKPDKGIKVWAPKLGTHYSWDCGCRFRYLCAGWTQVHTCQWHAERWTSQGEAA